MSLLWLPSCRKVILHVIANCFIEMHPPDVQLFDRMCHSLGKLFFFGRLTCGVIFAYCRLSITFYARGTNSRSACSLSSPSKTDKDFVLGSK